MDNTHRHIHMDIGIMWDEKIYRGSRMAYALSNLTYSNHYTSHTNHTWDKTLVASIPVRGSEL